MIEPVLIAAACTCAYLGAGLVQARREAAICRADNIRHGERAPLWPVWLVVTLAWPMLAAQRYVLWLLILWDAAAARRSDRRAERRANRRGGGHG